LYSIQGKTLKETMQVMEDTYGFQATEKMFKTRVASWGLHKYQRRVSTSTTGGLPPNISSLRAMRPFLSRPFPTFPEPSTESDAPAQSGPANNNLLINMIQNDQTDSDPPSSPPEQGSWSPSPNSGLRYPLRTIIEIDHGPADLGVNSLAGKNTSRLKPDPLEAARRRRKKQRKHEVDIAKYLKKTQPDLSLARFRTISQDLKTVESVLDLIHQYYGSFTEAKWTRTFPSSPRTVMKEMTMCIDLNSAFPRGEEAPVHPTQIFGRYMVAVELLKSPKQSDKKEGWRLVSEAFDLFADVLAQQHTQLLRYFFQQVYDYRLNDHPQIRKQIFEMAAGISAATLGDQHPITLICRLLPLVEDKDEICVLAWKKSLELLDSNLGEFSDDSLRSKLSLSGDLIEQSKFQEAEDLLQQMLKAPGRPPTDYYMRSTKIRLAWLYRTQKRHKEAEDLLHEVMKLSRQCNPPGATTSFDAIYIAAETNLAQSMCDRNEFRTGEYILEAALERCTTAFGADHGYTTSVTQELENIRQSMADLKM